MKGRGTRTEEEKRESEHGCSEAAENRRKRQRPLCTIWRPRGGWSGTVTWDLAPLQGHVSFTVPWSPSFLLLCSAGTGESSANSTQQLSWLISSMAEKHVKLMFLFLKCFSMLWAALNVASESTRHAFSLPSLRRSDPHSPSPPPLSLRPSLSLWRRAL